MESLSHYSGNSGNGHGEGNTHETASGSDNNDERRRSGGDDNASRPMMMMQGGPALSAEEMMRQQQQHQQQQHHHQHQLPMASSGLQFQQYMTAQSSAEMNNAAQLLAAARMSGNFRGQEDPSSSMLRYQSSRPDLSPAAMKQLTSPKQGEPSASSAQQHTLASSATLPQSTQPPPFVFDGYAGWVCRHCSHLDHYYRGPNYVWMGGQQAPPNHFVEAHLRVCPAINQPWQFGAGASANINRAAAPLQMQNVMQQGGGQQMPMQQAAQQSTPDNRSQQQGHDQEYSRKRKHEATDPPSGGSSDFSQLSHQAPRMNTNDATSWQQHQYQQQQQQHNLPQMYSQWQQGGMMGMSGMGGMGGMHPGMSPAGSGGVPLYPPPPDPSGRSPMGSHTMMQGAMGDTMPPPPPKQPGVVHTGSYYPPQQSSVMHHFSPNQKRPTQKKLKSSPSPKGIYSSDEAYAKALSFLRKRADETTPLPTAPTDVKLIEEGDSNLLTDYFYFIIEQLAVCRLTEKDRKTRGGKRQDVAVGYGGLQCIHCAKAPSARKFFWSNVDRLANSFAGIPDHVLTCKMCPEDVTEALLVLKGRHNAQMSLLPRGSQKQFFRRMWKRLHAGDIEGASAASDSSSSLKRSSTITAASDSSLPTNESNTAAEKLKKAGTVSSREKVERVSLAVAQDKDWLSDLDCFIREQVEVFCANSSDVSKAVEYVPVSPGQVGLRCIHCAKSDEGAKGDAVLYPHS
eukprot:scaffold33512_cov113-Skeletonema_dohrnii-CCMP3373.AAC.10